MSVLSPIRNFTEQCAYYADRVSQEAETLVVNGRYASIKVQNNALVVQPGALCDQESEPTTYYRGKCPFDRVVILSKSGNLSLDALYWLKDQGVSVLMLDWKGDVVYSMSPEPASNASLRRLQYLTSGSDKGASIACKLVLAKTEAQYETVKRHPELNNREYLLDLLRAGINELESPDYRFTDVDYIRLYEARLAAEYFDSFVGAPIRWQKKDQRIVPPHWQEITTRTSGLSDKNARHATNPFHAALNYLYSVVEHQLLCYIHASGLDAACGFLHVDKNGRESLLYDLIEPHRAYVDDMVLSWFNRNVLKRGDVTVFPSGEIALNPELARYLVVSAGIDPRKLKDSVTWFKGQLLSGD